MKRPLPAARIKQDIYNLNISPVPCIVDSNPVDYTLWHPNSKHRPSNELAEEQMLYIYIYIYIYMIKLY